MAQITSIQGSGHVWAPWPPRHCPQDRAAESPSPALPGAKSLSPLLSQHLRVQTSNSVARNVLTAPETKACVNWISDLATLTPTLAPSQVRRECHKLETRCIVLPPHTLMSLATPPQVMEHAWLEKSRPPGFLCTCRKCRWVKTWEVQG